MDAFLNHKVDQMVLIDYDGQRRKIYILKYQTFSERNNCISLAKFNVGEAKNRQISIYLSIYLELAEYDTKLNVEN